MEDVAPHVGRAGGAALSGELLLLRGNVWVALPGEASRGGEFQLEGWDVEDGKAAASALPHSKKGHYEGVWGIRSFRARGTILNSTGRRASGSPSTWA